MPTSTLQIPHQLGITESKLRISKFAQAVRQNPGMATDIQDSWSENSGTFSFKVFGMAISGNVEVQPNNVQIEISYPLAAVPFKSRIEQEILGKAQALLS